jgi:uncharacterized membrane protein
MAITFPPHLFAALDISALIFLGVAFFLTFKLRKLMGEGRDTAPVKLLTGTIAIIIVLGASLLAAIYEKSIGGYVNYARITDFMMFVIGIILTLYIYKIYKDYKKLIKKHEPNL